MSQAYQGITAGSLPPVVPINFLTDSGTAIPAAGILTVVGAQSSSNADSGVATSGAGSTLTVNLTNRVLGTLTTNTITLTPIITYALGATPGTFIVQGDIIAYNITDLSSAAYTFTGALRTNGVTAVELGVDNRNIFEDASMQNCDFTFSVSGNNFIIKVQGLNGKTIDWSAFFNYRTVS